MVKAHVVAKTFSFFISDFKYTPPMYCTMNKPQNHRFFPLEYHPLNSQLCTSLFQCCWRMFWFSFGKCFEEYTVANFVVVPTIFWLTPCCLLLLFLSWSFSLRYLNRSNFHYIFFLCNLEWQDEQILYQTTSFWDCAVLIIHSWMYCYSISTHGNSTKNKKNIHRNK